LRTIWGLGCGRNRGGRGEGKNKKEHGDTMLLGRERLEFNAKKRGKPAGTGKINPGIRNVR